MQSLKKVICVIILASVISINSCSKESPSSETKTKPVIGVSLLMMTNPFFIEMADGMKAEAEKQGFDLVLTAGELDPAKQNDQVRDFLVRKVSAIVLTPCDSKSIGPAIIEANKAGVPVFTADCGCEAKDAKVVSHIATDNFMGGRLLGQKCLKDISRKGRIAIINHPEIVEVKKRSGGFVFEIEKAKKEGADVQIVTDLPANSDRGRAFKVMQDILQSNPDVNAIFCINDSSALGAVAALEKVGKIGKIKVYGYDGLPEARRAIRDGKMSASAIQFPGKIGQMTIATVGKYLAGEKVEPKIQIQTSLYDNQTALSDKSLK